MVFAHILWKFKIFLGIFDVFCDFLGATTPESRLWCLWEVHCQPFWKCVKSIILADPAPKTYRIFFRGIGGQNKAENQNFWPISLFWTTGIAWKCPKMPLRKIDFLHFLAFFAYFPPQFTLQISCFQAKMQISKFSTFCSHSGNKIQDLRIFSKF